MNLITLPIGIVCALAGIAVAALSGTVLHENRRQNILTGVFFAVLGVAIVWLSLQGSSTWRLPIPISNKLGGMILAGFVMSLFVVRGILDIQEGSKRLLDKTSSPYQIAKSWFQIVFGIVWTTFILIISAIAFTHIGR